MSIRLRLTLWYVLLLAVILIVFSGALYSILSLSLYNEVDRTLETRAGEVQRGADAAMQIQSDVRQLFARGRFFLPSADAFATPGIYVQIMTLDGTAVSRSENLSDQTLSITSAVLDRVAQGSSIFTNSSVAKVQLRTFVSPLNAGNRAIGMIVVAQSLESVNDTLSRLATLLGFWSHRRIASGVHRGAFLARRALAPIDQMTQAAHSIAEAGDLTRRLDQPKTRDEVGRLAATFNDMLGRIEELFRAQQRILADVHTSCAPL